MNDFDSQEADGGASMDAPEDFEVEISDLPPSERSHYLLIGLQEMKKRLHATARAFILLSSHTPEQSNADEFEIEISDLPPDTRGHYLLLKASSLSKRLRAIFAGSRPAQRRGNEPALRRARRRAGIGRALTAFGICAAILVLIAGNVPALRSQALGFFEPGLAPTPTAVTLNSNPGPVAVGRSGRNAFGSLHVFVGDGPGLLPSSCPKLTTLQTFTTPLDPPGLGGGPLWVSGFDGPTATLINLQPTSMSLSLGNAFIGWYSTLAVFIQKGFAGTITLRGESQGEGGIVMFSYADLLAFTSALTLDPNKAGIGQVSVAGGTWEMIPVDILVSSAGCYALQASWSGAGWTQYFAAGD
ncbi:MAG TPA: hypothetical protein VKV19_07805 [Ktedonobacteraceae bacterium]|nr:hypothetical protein [Ktedonobacteraceae bacterium]